MNVDSEQPQLLLTQKTASEHFGKCSSCGRSFHAFVRSTEKEALWLLTRSFRLHCRRIHSLVVHPALAVDEMVESLPLPAYVCAKSSRKLMAANQRFRDVMGYSADEIAELRLDDFRAPEDVPLLLESLQRAGGGMLDRRYRTKDGRFLQVRLRYQDINLFQNETAVRDARFVVLTSIEAA